MTQTPDKGQTDLKPISLAAQTRVLARTLANRPAEEIEGFLADLCTPAELKALAGRWQAAQLLNSGRHSYRDIADRTGMSTTTIGRVARFLFAESNQGYRRVLDQMQEPEE